MKNLTINNQFLSTSEFLIPSSTGEYLPTNITVIYAATDAEEINEELFELISILSNSLGREFFNFKLTENSLTFETFTQITEDDQAEFDDTIANWMDHAEYSECPEQLNNFDWKISQTSITFTW